MRKFVEISGISSWVDAQWIQGKLWIHFQGRTFCVEKPQNLSRGRKSNAPESLNLFAPMPGKITKILIGAGQLVTKGQAILVMEAMKMEYTLKASAAGKIEKLDCKVGDQVKMSALLVELSAAEGQK